MEVWKPIAGFEGRYEVSDQGRVRSLPHTVQRRSKYGALHDFDVKGQVLTPVVCTNGYLRVSLGATNLCLVHRLVAAAFVEGDQTLHVNHKNGHRSDNRAANLDWVTCSENHLHAYRELPRKPHARTRAVKVDGQVFTSGFAAAKSLGVTPGSISSAATHGHKCKGKEVAYV